MTKEDYLGLDKDHFCYWLEFKKLLAGIGGGYASKFTGQLHSCSVVRVNLFNDINESGVRF